MESFESFLTKRGIMRADSCCDPRVGDFVQGRYQILRTLEGCMSLVHICLDHEEGRLYALKTLQQRFLCNHEAMDSFLREIKTWVSIGKHANIVEAIWILTGAQHRHYIVMEYVSPSRTQGNTLRSYLLSGKICTQQALVFAIQVCDGMIHATKVVPRLVHRDIKPENLMVTPDGIVKITDFGLAKIAADYWKDPDENISSGISRFRSAAFVGTPPYMSPEQALGQEVDTRSDIYSLGCVLYEMMTGRFIFPASTVGEFLHHHVNTVPENPQSFSGEIPVGLTRVILRCLEKNPQDRFQSFIEIRENLSDVFCQLTGSTRAVEVVRSPPPEEWELVDKAASMIAIDRIDQAISLLKKVINDSSVPKRFRAKAHNNLGCCYRNGNEGTDAAILEFKEATRIDPNYAKAHYNLGLCYEDKGMTRDAICEFAQTIEANPHFEEVHTALRRCLDRSMNRKEVV